jgi:uncharacterized phiE125 gp8 family phage protein
MALNLVTPPDVQPVELPEAVAQCSVQHMDDDALIATYIEAATTHVENVTNRQLITATWEMTLDYWPMSIDIPRAPLQSVVSVQYVDTAGTTTTLATNQYRWRATSGPFAERGRITRGYGVSWPSLQAVTDPVIVRFTAGYGTSGADVPAPLRHAILMLVAHWYMNREAVGTVGEEIALAFDALVGPYRTFPLSWCRAG